MSCLDVLVTAKSRVQILLTVPIYSVPTYILAYCCDWSSSSPKNTILIKHKANKHKNHTNMITLLLCGFTQHTLLILNDTNKYINLHLLIWLRVHTYLPTYVSTCSQVVNMHHLPTTHAYLSTYLSIVANKNQKLQKYFWNDF